jgi:cytochrome P450
MKHSTRDEGTIWSLFSYEAAMVALDDPFAFSSEGGSLLGTGAVAPPGVGKMMALADPPRHRELRSPVMPFFSSKHAGRLKARVAELAEGIVDRAVERGDVEFVQDAASILPMEVMCDLMGVPSPDRGNVVGMCDSAFLGHTREERSEGHLRLMGYLFELAIERREAPASDVVSAVATHRVDGELLPLEDVVLNCDNVLVGGVQTVRHAASMGLLALIQHPGGWQALREGADVGLAVEELLRWTAVGSHTVRTTRQTVTVAGTEIPAGQRLVVWLTSANRDEAVFERADALDLARPNNRHLAFGAGPHYCIGAHLARLELRVLFSELIHKVKRVEQTGPAVPNHSIIDLGLESLPLRLHPA